MEDRILTLHPQGKHGTRINLARYEQMRAAILEALRTHGTMTFSGLGQVVENELSGRFEGAIGWYFTTAKLDLEARGLIVRLDQKGPQRICLAVTTE